MLITGRQIAAARSLLNISQDDLAKKAGVGRVTIARFENGDSEPRDNIIEALKTTIENMGIEFIHGGAIPRRSSIKQIFGSDCFVKLLEMICYKLNKGEEVLFICSYENLSPPDVVNMLVKAN
jgi:predicted transcriptional regulator